MPNPSGTLLTRLTMEIAVALAAALAGALVCYGSLDIGIGWGDAGPQPGYFPFYIGLCIVLASCGVLLEAIVKERRLRQVFLTREQGRRMMSFFLPMLGFVAVSMVLGLYVGLGLYLFGTMTIQGGYRIGKALAVCASTIVIFYVVFEQWFQVPLLKGPLEALLHIY
jgi:hypothetical protein